MRLLVALCLVIGLQQALSQKNVVCFYDSASFLRQGFAKMTLQNVEFALEFCTHLIYGYAGLHPTSLELTSLNVDLDMFHYRDVTVLKRKYPELKVYLSVGGDRDIDENHPLKYVGLLESDKKAQQTFIDSAVALLKRNGFDGLDLAFQLPRNKPRKVHSNLGIIWKDFKKLFTGDFIVDPLADEHKKQYTELARNLRSAFSFHNLSLSMTVLPNVNSTWYFDVPAIKNTFDLINLAAFDFLTPDRNPEEADFTAPLYAPPEQNRLPHYNVDFQVKYWLDNGVRSNTLNLGVAAYGRAWTMTSGTGLTGTPVVPETLGPAPAGLQSQQAGLLSWPEICSKLANSVNANYRGATAPLRSVNDLDQKYGKYALRPADENGEHGMWVSYDDPDFAAVKARYAKSRVLGGVALFDLSYDDFRGLCTGAKYPLLRSMKYEL